MKRSVRKLAFGSVFTALIFVLTMFVKIPAATGYLHCGDALVYLCALYLGVPWAPIAAAIGEGLADVAGGYAMYLPATMIIKILITVPFIAVRRRRQRFLSVVSVLMSVVSGALSVAGYFFADCLINRSYAVVNLAGNAGQAAASAIIFILLAAAFDKAKIKERFGFEE